MKRQTAAFALMTFAFGWQTYLWRSEKARADKAEAALEEKMTWGQATNPPRIWMNPDGSWAVAGGTDTEYIITDPSFTAVDALFTLTTFWAYDFYTMEAMLNEKLDSWQPHFPRNATEEEAELSRVTKREPRQPHPWWK